MSAEPELKVYSWRFAMVSVCLVSAVIALGWRVIELQVIDRGFLQSEGNARVVRTERVAATRGVILDRRGEPLAVSTLVSSIWADPTKVPADQKLYRQLADELGISARKLEKKLHPEREFVYLRRHVLPELAERVMALDIPGIFETREARRYYPAGEAVAHVVGMTNVDDQGQEGLELAYDKLLAGHAGSRQLLKDRRGRTIRNLRVIESAQSGQDLQTTIDMRLQYFAYRELKAAVRQHRAQGGSVVMLDVESGEVLAMANQPSFNPNDRSHIKVADMRNRAVTDAYEPGSTVKPFTVAAALETGRYHPATRLDTSPGQFRVGKKIVRDHRDYGVLDIAGILAKSSNVGVTRLALDLKAGSLRDLFQQLGFGEMLGVGYPGENTGYLPSRVRWKPIETATLSYGYGLSVSPLQLADAYLTLANHGVRRSVHLVRPQASREPVQAMSPRVADKVLSMLEGVTVDGGTGTRAAVPGYRIAGKTGTTHKVGREGYRGDQYVAVFAGVAPVSSPRLVCVVVVDQPRGDKYYGGEVAAPVFSRVTGEALRILNVAPDKVDTRVVHHDAVRGIRDQNADA